MVLANDITKRKQAEDALKLSEEKYRDLFDNANDAICIVDSDLKFRDAKRNYGKKDIMKNSLERSIQRTDAIEMLKSIHQR